MEFDVYEQPRKRRTKPRTRNPGLNSAKVIISGTARLKLVNAGHTPGVTREIRQQLDAPY